MPDVRGKVRSDQTCANLCTAFSVRCPVLSSTLSIVKCTVWH